MPAIAMVVLSEVFLKSWTGKFTEWKCGLERFASLFWIVLDFLLEGIDKHVTCGVFYPPLQLKFIAFFKKFSSISCHLPM
jgi:predicted permease